MEGFGSSNKGSGQFTTHEKKQKAVQTGKQFVPWDFAIHHLEDYQEKWVTDLQLTTVVREGV